jgi:hypothetical protein
MNFLLSKLSYPSGFRDQKRGEKRRKKEEAKGKRSRCSWE